MALDSENLTYWYFRLNGFFTIPNFVVHPDIGIGQQTDVDVLGVRFPHRQELPQNPMRDDAIFAQVTKIFLAIAEVKRAAIKINTTWLDRDLRTIDRVLSATGLFESSRITAIADEIYAQGCCVSDPNIHVSIVGIGDRENRPLRRSYPLLPQITWPEIATFIYRRFHDYPEQKQLHEQWDAEGKQLWELSFSTSDLDEFRTTILDAINH